MHPQGRRSPVEAETRPRRGAQPLRGWRRGLGARNRLGGSHWLQTGYGEGGGTRVVTLGVSGLPGQGLPPASRVLTRPERSSGRDSGPARQKPVPREGFRRGLAPGLRKPPVREGRMNYARFITRHESARLFRKPSVSESCVRSPSCAPCPMGLEVGVGCLPSASSLGEPGSGRLGAEIRPE